MFQKLKQLLFKNNKALIGNFLFAFWINFIFWISLVILVVI